MNPAEIYDALAALAAKPYDPVEFPFDFALATDNTPATVAKLKGGTFNKSDILGGVLMNQKFHFAPALTGMAAVTLDALRANKRTLKHKPAILIATDGVEIAAEHPKSGDTLHCAFTELGDRFGFFLPAAGKERYRAAEENPVDVKVSGKLAKLYDALIRRNPDWATDARRHDMNQLMTRLIFCLFAEDVGIFPDNQFSRLIFTHSGDKGEGMREVLISAFTAMNTPRDRRDALPAWTREFEYVNGGLFAGGIDAPVFDAPSARYLRDVSAENWKGINPDIFGSMIQSVADAKLRSELGMHYTSVPNIMKVLGPLFLDDLDAEIEKAWDRERALRQVLDRIAKIRVFDPACGSGNFLVVAYRALREREIRILTRLAELTGGAQTEMWSVVPIRNFYGIDLADFAVETAKLALFIAEYQANALFQQAFGRKPADLPLRDAANITCDNALRVNWERVCPVPEDGGEVFIAGNPPYVGAKKRKPSQTQDMVLCGLSDVLLLDYVAAWFFKAAEYSGGKAKFAFVATSSICQGEQVAPMWSKLLNDAAHLQFAYRPFMWRNSAADNAGVWVTIVGVGPQKPIQAQLFDDDLVSTGAEVSPYLAIGPFIPVVPVSGPIFGMPQMVMGSNPVDGRHLSLTAADRASIVEKYPDAERFIKPYIGGDELIEESDRFCVWIEDDEVPDALKIPPISDRVAACMNYRRSAGRDARKSADTPHRFCYQTYQSAPSIAIPNSQSSDRLYVPAVMVGPNVVLSKEAFAIYNSGLHVVAVVSSRLHRLWLSAVGGRIGNGFRYSVKIVYNNFPVPSFTQTQVEALEQSARGVLRTRYGHYPATIADLYDPEKMPDDLRAAHKANDDLLESMYIGRPFRNDTERLEHLFKLYAARVKKLKKGAA